MTVVDEYVLSIFIAIQIVKQIDSHLNNNNSITSSFHEQFTLQYEYDLLHELSVEIEDCMLQQCFMGEHTVVARLQKRLLKLVN